MIKKRILFATLFSIQSVFLYSAISNFENAYIIPKTGDTLYGKIQRKKELSLTFEINFIKEESSKEIIVYKPDEIYGFGFPERHEVYKSVTYRYFKDNEKVFTKRFARQIFADEVILFKLDVPDEETNYEHEKYESYAFVLQIDTSYYTLSQRETVKKVEQSKEANMSETHHFKGGGFNPITTYSVLRKDYISTFRYLVQDCPKALKTLNNLLFYEKNIKKYVEKNIACFVVR